MDCLFRVSFRWYLVNIMFTSLDIVWSWRQMPFLTTKNEEVNYCSFKQIMSKASISMPTIITKINTLWKYGYIQWNCFLIVIFFLAWFLNTMRLWFISDNVLYLRYIDTGQSQDVYVNIRIFETYSETPLNRPPSVMECYSNC